MNAMRTRLLGTSDLAITPLGSGARAGAAARLHEVWPRLE